MVQSKLAMSQFLLALAYSLTGLLTAIWLAILIDRLFHVQLPKQFAFLWAGCGVAVLLAVVYSLIRRPTSHAAAVAIDERLSLKEKFSTALMIRNSSDPFAKAAVLDAERTADNVSLHKRFPIAFPKAGFFVPVAALLVLITGLWFPSMDLFGHEAQQKLAMQNQKKNDDALKVVKQAIATVSAYPKSMQAQPAIQLAQKELKDLLDQPVKDPGQTARSAYKALQQANDAVKEEIKKNQNYATAENDKKMFQTLNPPAEAEGPVAEAQKELAKGNFAKASDEIAKVAEKFNSMSDAEKQKAAQQMQQMAQQLQKMAQNPAQQQQLQQKLQQLGANQQQAQQLAQTMQQAAQGNQQAQQQLQQMQQQLAKQLNNGKGATQQQQQAMQQMAQQAQAQANAQQNIQQMAQAAQQMAQAMQQGAQQQQGQGQQKGQQQKQGQGQQQQMAQAQQQMQQAMGQMDAVAKDAQEMAAAQESTNQASDDAAAAADGKGEGKDGKDGKGKGQGQWAQGDKPGQGGGAGGMGKGGAGGSITESPFSMKHEVAHSKNIDDGKILASTFVKADPLKNSSKIQLSQAAKSSIQESTDEVDEDSISKESQRVVKDYFETMQKE